MRSIALRLARLAALSIGMALPAIGLALPARAATLCTVVADVASGAVLVREGDCATRTTPASTFKLPLAVIGYDSGFLKSDRLPELKWKMGEPDWGGKAWKAPTTPRDWMKYSVVWYSQRIAADLGSEKLTGYGRRLAYGNADFSGDPGQNNGLLRSWIASSLLISPDEQITFLTALSRSTLPVKPEAMTAAVSLLDQFVVGGWTVRGKTGSAFPRKADGTFDRNRGWGWFVGLAERDGRVLAFARLTQDEGPVRGSAGIRTRDGLLADWAALAAR